MSSTPHNPLSKTPDEQFSDTLLRPNSFAEYIGQSHIKKNLSILIGAAKERGQTPEHILFYGPPGLGKTTLAHVIAREIGANIRVTSGPAIERVGDLAAILTNLQPGDMLFIDEIHRLNKAIEEAKKFFKISDDKFENDVMVSAQSIGLIQEFTFRLY